MKSSLGMTERLQKKKEAILSRVSNPKGKPHFAQSDPALSHHHYPSPPWAFLIIVKDRPGSSTHHPAAYFDQEDFASSDLTWLCL